MTTISMRPPAPVVRKQAGLRRYFGDDLAGLAAPAALEESALPRLLRVSILALSASVLGFIVWAAFTPVKEVAKTEGRVIPFGYNRLVQHLEGGLVRDILVREGDFVQKDQLLMRVDGAGTEEDLHEQDGLVTSLALQAERLRATLEDRLPDFARYDASAAQKAQQRRMFDATMDARSRERAVLGEQIEQRKRLQQRAREMLTTAKSNLAVAEESRDIYAKLDRERLTAHSNFLRMLEEYNTRKGDVASIGQQLESAGTELREYRQRLEALAAQQRDTAYGELHKIETELASQQDEMKKRADRVTRLEVRAPVMGYVKGLKINTIGAVIPAGQTLMELVPVDEHLIVEVQILPQQVGRIAVGQEVQVKVDSYDYIRFGSITGKLEFISATTFVDEQRHEDYYRGRVRLAHNYVGQAPGAHPVIPGMTVDADIVTGEKSVLGYLLRPIQNALASSMTEK